MHKVHLDAVSSPWKSSYKSSFGPGRMERDRASLWKQGPCTVSLPPWVPPEALALDPNVAPKCPRKHFIFLLSACRVHWVILQFFPQEKLAGHCLLLCRVNPVSPFHHGTGMGGLTGSRTVRIWAEEWMVEKSGLCSYDFGSAWWSPGYFIFFLEPWS